MRLYQQQGFNWMYKNARLGLGLLLSDMQGQADITTEDLSLPERLALPMKKILKESVISD